LYGVQDHHWPHAVEPDELLASLNLNMKHAGLQAAVIHPEQLCEQAGGLYISALNGVLVLLPDQLPSEPLAMFVHDSRIGFLQRQLVRVGLLSPDQVDSIQGPVTMTALARFQRAAGLPATGQMDHVTLHKLTCGRATAISSGGV
jgi:peptidoglycan hydrolase-like protein with peptidoglycan-binding domain